MKQPFQRQGREKKRVLFLCHHNAVRSQMAEALLRARFSGRYDAASAGASPSGVHPLTLRVLEEAGVSTRGLRSKHVAELEGRAFDIVVTVCGSGNPACPFFPGGEQWHREFGDPSAVRGSDEDRLLAFRRVRDEIDSWICSVFGRDAGPGRDRPPIPWRQIPLETLLQTAGSSVDAALQEDDAFSDVTSEAAVSPDATLTAFLRAKEPGVVAGLPVAEMTFRRIDPRVRFTARAVDGQGIMSGETLGEVRGPARAILAGERTALNFLQRMSGIATQTRRYVDAVATTGAIVLDTRKTAPGLRALDKYAVRVGGGTNHRLSLGALALVKENHIDAAGGVATAVAAVRSRRGLVVEVEVRSLEELDQTLALEPLPDAILLDNLPLEILQEAVRRVAGRTWTEASGGVTMATIRDIARTGVDAVSVGALTHSAPALDLSLDIVSESELKTRRIVPEAGAVKRALGARLLVLAHHYVRDEIMPFADVRGDSLELARAAASSHAQFIVLCGVRFMGETVAALAAPGQAVFLPVPSAGCSLADCAREDDVRAAWAAVALHGGAIPLAYVNSSLAIKAFCGESGGATCTSANAEAMLQWALSAGERVLFLPDRNLALNAARALSLPKSQVLVWDTLSPPGEQEIRGSRLIIWPGACCVHRRFSLRHLEEVRRRLPGVCVAVHPECDPDVACAADLVGSTSQIIRWVEQAPAGSAFAVGTEHRLVARLAAEHPDKTVVGLSDVPSFCASMGMIRVDDLTVLLRGLEQDGAKGRVEVPAPLVAGARLAMGRMFEVSGGRSIESR